MELEIGNRSILHMREDFLLYFLTHPSLVSVIAIKVSASGGELSQQRQQVAVLIDLLFPFCFCSVSLSPRGRRSLETD